MVNWYYVDGSERVGPIGVEELISLYRRGKLNQESYIWRKGFANWERIKNVTEIEFEEQNETEELESLDSNELEELSIPKVKSYLESIAKPEVKQKSFDLPSMDENEFKIERGEVKVETPSSVEPFSWNHVGRDEEIFFVKVGHDRPNISPVCYGPYSLNEILHAIAAKRMNERTLLFTLGFDSWQSVASIPFFKEELGLVALAMPINAKHPLNFVAQEDGEYFYFLIKAISNKNAKLLTNFDPGSRKEMKVSMFVGSRLVKQGMLLKFEERNQFERSINVTVHGINEEVKDVIKDFNE